MKKVKKLEFDVQIKKIGQVQNIFSFYKYLLESHNVKNSVLLESISEEEQKPLFSFIGADPDFMVSIKNENLKIDRVSSERGEKIKETFASLSASNKHDQDNELPFEDTVQYPIKALDQLKEIFPIQSTPLPELFPRNIFSGGLMGYIGYDAVAPWVGYKAHTPEQFPDVLMGCYTKVFVYSHNSKTLYLVDNTLGTFKPLEIQTDYLKNYKDMPIKTFKKPQIDTTHYKSNTTEQEWDSMIEKCKEHIFAGDIIQAVLSRKMRVENEVNALKVYEALRQFNPSPYMYYLNYSDIEGEPINIIGSSPEALITMNQGIVETVPIAGTRRRGKTPEDELKMEQELLTSEKETAEHIMLVDLARNDLAKVCYPNSVETYELMKIKKYPHVMHIVSKVRGKSPYGPFDVLKSAFPAGTVSGAPKLKAMEIIQNLEKENRGPYAGVVGYVSFAGNCDFAIAIRTIFNRGKTYIAQAGAGIVADSKSQEEYLETKNKMLGTAYAINAAIGDEKN